MADPKETRLALFVGGGEDHQFIFQVLNGEGYPTRTTVAESLAIDITGWGLSFMVKRRLGDADSAALLAKTSGAGDIAISGVFNAVITTNTQVATVTVLDTDLDDFIQGLFVWELKRTGAGVESVLGRGPIEFIRSVHKS